MAANRQREGAAERREEKTEWERFRRGLSEIKTFRGAMTFANSRRSPLGGCPWYANLGYFLHNLSLRNGTSDEETYHLHRLSQAMEDAGDLQAGTTMQIFGNRPRP
jgi:hypothetical protein